MRLEGALNGRDCSTQFCSVFPIAGVSKRAQKLMRMGLQDNSTGTHDFPPLASSVAGSTQGAQTPLGSRPIRRLRPRALAGCLACPIHIENEEVVPLPIPEPTWMLLFSQRARKPIFQKQGS